jgi:hypothetical protein
MQVEPEELRRLREQESELLRLRGQVGALATQLRLATNAIGQAGANAAPSSAQSNAPPASMQVGLGHQADVAKFSDRGQHSPEAALETLLWAAQNQPVRFAELVQMPDVIRRSPEKLASVVKNLAQQLNASQQGVTSVRLQSLQYWGATAWRIPTAHRRSTKTWRITSPTNSRGETCGDPFRAPRPLASARLKPSAADRFLSAFRTQRCL